MGSSPLSQDAPYPHAPPQRARAGNPAPSGTRWALAAAVLVVLALLAVLAGTTGGRTAVRALFFVPAMFPGSPLLPLDLISGSPRCEEITLRYAGVEAPADLCVPQGSGPHGAIVLTLGVHPLDRHDPFVAQVTDALTRTGLVVLRPASPDLAAGIIAPREVDGLVAAFQALEARPEVDPTRVGLAGFSAGGALSTIAAADPRIRDQVRLVYTFGAYYDARDVLGAISDGRIRADGIDEAWTPHPWSVHVFVEQVVYALPPGSERDYWPPRSPIPAWSARRKIPLSRLGQMLYALGVEGQRVDGAALLAALPPDTRETFRRLSPATVVDDLRAPVT